VAGGRWGGIPPTDGGVIMHRCRSSNAPQSSLVASPGEGRRWCRNVGLAALVARPVCRLVRDRPLQGHDRVGGKLGLTDAAEILNEHSMKKRRPTPSRLAESRTLR
jgi:hypothetical protein